jgi:hypothetical protein
LLNETNINIALLKDKCEWINITIDYILKGITITLHKVSVGSNNNQKRSALASPVNFTLANLKLTLESLYILEGQIIDIITSNVVVNGDLILFSNSILSINPPQSTLTVVNGCLKIYPGARIIINNNGIQNVTNQVIIASKCTEGFNSNEISLSNDTANNICYSISAIPKRNSEPNITLSYNSTLTSCPSASLNSPAESIAWIAAPLIIFLILIILLIYFFVKRKTSAVPEGTVYVDKIPEVPFWVIAIASYEAIDESQISIHKGVRYEVYRIDEGNYWFQSRSANGKLGWFPASYVKILEKEKDSKRVNKV